MDAAKLEERGPGARARDPLQQTVGPIHDGPVEAPIPASPAEKQHDLIIFRLWISESAVLVHKYIFE